MNLAVSAQANPLANPLSSTAPLSALMGVTPPYAVAPVSFGIPALADAAGSSTLSGDRELALGGLMVARLMLAALPPAPLSIIERTQRAERTRHWLMGLSMPQPARMAFLRAIDSSIAPGSDATAALRELAQLLTGHLPDAALRELVALAERLRLYYDERP